MNAELLQLISDSIASTTAGVVDVLQANFVTVVLVVLGIGALIAFVFWINPFKKRKI